jgi:hypothetical protein
LAHPLFPAWQALRLTLSDRRRRRNKNPSRSGAAGMLPQWEERKAEASQAPLSLDSLDRRAGASPTKECPAPATVLALPLLLVFFLFRQWSPNPGALHAFQKELCGILAPTEGAVLMWPQHLVHPATGPPAQASQESTSTVWQVSVCSAAATLGHLKASGHLQVVRLEGCPDDAGSPQLAEGAPDYLLTTAAHLGPDQFYAYSVRAPGTYRLVLWALRDSWEALTEREYRYGQVIGDK